MRPTDCRPQRLTKPRYPDRRQLSGTKVANWRNPMTTNHIQLFASFTGSTGSGRPYRPNTSYGPWRASALQRAYSRVTAVLPCLRAAPKAAPSAPRHDPGQGEAHIPSLIINKKELVFSCGNSNEQ